MYSAHSSSLIGSQPVEQSTTIVLEVFCIFSEDSAVGLEKEFGSFSSIVYAEANDEVIEAVKTKEMKSAKVFFMTNSTPFQNRIHDCEIEQTEEAEYF